jgi:hypothetical protein
MWGKVVESGENFDGDCWELAFSERIAYFFTRKTASMF